MLKEFIDTLQAFAIFAVAVFFALLCSPLWIVAAPAIVMWYRVPAASDLELAAA